MQVCKWPLQGSGQLFHATRPRVTEPRSRHLGRRTYAWTLWDC